MIELTVGRTKRRGFETVGLVATVVLGLARIVNAQDFELGDLIAKFDPPTLAALDAKAEWLDQPVLDGVELLREKQRREKPLASVERSLMLENKSPRANAILRNVLGRLPERDEDVDWDASITRHAAGDVRSLNPLMISSTTEFDVSDLIGFGLFSFDWNFRPFAARDSVARWQTSKDRLLDKVVLRDDLTWSDGKPITAHDVEFSYQVIMSSQVPVPAVRHGTDRIRYVKAYDDRTLVFFHKKPLATNVWNVNFLIIPQHVYKDSIADDPTMARSEYHVELNKKPVVGGAYRIAIHVPRSEILLVGRPGYYMHKGKQVRDRSYFDEVRFKFISDSNDALLAMKAGVIDEMVLTPEQWMTKRDDAFNARNVSVYGLEWVFFYFGWNCKSPLFADHRARQAMSFAMDYSKMLKETRHGMDQQGTGVFHPSSRWASKSTTLYKQDVEKAGTLLKAAGWADTNGDGILDKSVGGRQVPFAFSIMTTNRPDRIAICRLLSKNLKRIGVLCTVVPTDFSVLQQRSRDHKFQAIFAGWGTGTDPDTMDQLWTTDAPRNYVQYSYTEVDKLFERGRREFDPKKRSAIYARIHEILWKDQPYTWLYWRNSYYAFNKDLRGYNFSPRGPYAYSPGFSSIWKPAEK